MLTCLKRKKYSAKKIDVFNIVSIGRLVQKKGFPFLIRACKIFKEKYGKNFRCTIIGTGNLKKIVTKFN